MQPGKIRFAPAVKGQIGNWPPVLGIENLHRVVGEVPDDLYPAPGPGVFQLAAVRAALPGAVFFPAGLRLLMGEIGFPKAKEHGFDKAVDCALARLVAAKDHVEPWRQGEFGILKAAESVEFEPVHRYHASTLPASKASR